VNSFVKSIIKVFLLLSLSVLLFTTCEDIAGLGPKVNTEKPVIKSDEDGSQPGDFLQGPDNEIWLNVEQEFGISRVYMDVEYIDVDTGEKKRKRIEAEYDAVKERWKVNLDTTKMQDGKITAWVTAIDVDGNRTTTTEIIYTVKNTPPQIKLNMPLVDGNNWDDDVFLDNLQNNDPLYLGFELLGLAEDNYGIAEGYPKIMIWPSEGPTDLDEDGIPFPTNKLYGSWYSLEVPNPRSGLTATKFSWPMTTLVDDGAGGWKLPDKGKGNSLNEGIYRIRIVTKDLFGNENYYPDRTDHGTNQASKKYIEINYKTSDRPVVQITNAPQYYNGVGNFDVYLTVSSVSPVSAVEAWITDGQDGYEKDIIGGDSPYPFSNFSLESEYNSVYKYKLTITPSEAASWPSNVSTRTDINSPARKGLMYVRIKAKAGSKDGLYAYQNFIFDNTPPEVTIDRPSMLLNKIADKNITGGTYKILYPDNAKPRWVTGAITVGGTSKDNYTLSKVYYHIGKLGDDKVSDAEREAIYANDSNWEDTKLDFNTMAKGWGGSVYSWTYSFDPFDKDYKTTADGIRDSQKTSDLLNFTSNDYSATEIDPSHPLRVRFYLPFYVKVVDTAGNFSVVHYKLSIDPLLDEPVVTITQPQVSYDIFGEPITPIVGGTVRVAGFAEDNFWMHTVLVRVKKEGVPGYYIPDNVPEILPFYSSNPSFLPKPPGDDTAGWFLATKIGDSNNVNWYANINQDRKLDPSGDPGDKLANVTVEVIAIDCDETDLTHEKTHMTGPIETLKLKFSKDVPLIENMVIKKDGVADRKYDEGIKASGKFSFSFDVKAIEDINSLTARVNGELVNLVIGTSKYPSISPVAWVVSDPSVPDGDYKKRSVTVTIDSITSTNTTKIPGFSSITGFPLGNTGNLTLEVTAEDATENHLTTTNIFTIGIDNFYPTATEISTPHIASDSEAKGKYYFVAGKAQDYPGDTAVTIQGLERVLVYFEKALIKRTGDRIVEGSSNFVNPHTGALLSGDGYFVTYPNVLDPAVSPNPSSYARFPKITQDESTKVWRSDSALIIDNAEGGAIKDTNNDGTWGEIWDGNNAKREFGALVRFYANPGTWKDGPYIVHYLIVDQAGNATHYQHDIYLENNKPRITSINFGTEINGVGGITDGTADTLNEYLYYNTATGIAANEKINEPTVSSEAGVMSPSFRIRGYAFNVRLEVEKGNGSKGATVSFVSSSTSIPASTMKKGNVYTIDNLGSNMTDFTKYGAPNNVPGTTFVAAGPAATTTNGTVISYTLINRSPLPMAESVTSGTISFTPFTGVPDSDKNGIGEIENADKNKRLFIVKVYDTTVTTADGSIDGELDQLADAILVKVDIDNNDSKNPSINVLPFGEEYYINPNATPPLNDSANDGAKLTRDIPAAEYNKNIGMNGNVKGGYVQYAKHSTPAVANVSGKVKFLGKAEDNQKIDGIYVTITNYAGAGTGVAGTQFQIAKANDITGNLEPVAPAGNYAGQWEFKVLDNKNYFTQDYGHTLNWEFMWDSSKVNNTPANPGTTTNQAQNNVSITFQVRDAASPVRNAASQTTVNVVPYILEVETPLSKAYAASPSAFSRSALGGYPVRENEQITIRGFNLGTAIGNAKINGTSLPAAAPAGETVTPSINTANGTTTIVSYVPAGATSGELVVTVNDIESFNNKSNKTKTGDFFNTPYAFTAPYNWEPNGVNNNILNNSRYIYVWQAGVIDNSATVAQMYNPFMRVTANGTRLLSYGYYPQAQQGRLRVRRNNDNIATATSQQNRMTNTTIAASSSNSWYAAGSDITAGNYPFKFAYSNAAGNDYQNQVNIVAAIGSDSNRFKIPRIAVQSTNNTNARSDTNGDRILMSYYDADNSRIEIIYGSVANTAVGNIPGTPVVVAHSNTANAVTHKASMYTAVGFLSNGIPLITWYDSVNDSLKFSWGNNTPANTIVATRSFQSTANAANTDAPAARLLTYNNHGLATNDIVTVGGATRYVYVVSNNTFKLFSDAAFTTANPASGTNGNVTVTVAAITNSYATTTQADWQTNAKTIDTNKGAHVDMVVDANDNVHLAYFDLNNGGLYYAIIPPNSSTGTARRPDTSNVKPVKVDTFLSAGTKIMITVRSDGTRPVPYITYAHASFAGTRNSIRVAWRTDFTNNTQPLAGSDASDAFSGKWEAMTVPVSKGATPQVDDFVCNGVPTSATWTAPGTTGDYLQYNTRLDQTVIVGYLTDKWYEGAIIKGNILSVPSSLQK